MKKTIIISFIFILLGATPMDKEVLNIFKDELKLKGLKIENITDDGLIIIDVNESKLTISLDNVTKNYYRDNKNKSSIISLVNIISNYGNELPNWKTAKKLVFCSAEANDNDLSDTIHDNITDTFSKVYVYYDGKSVVWISNNILEKWKIKKSDLIKAADDNMNIELKKAKIKTELVENNKLFWIDSDLPFKSSLIFASNFKKRVKAEIGLPVFCVIPARDFIYLFSDKEKDYFLTKIGHVVVDEFNKSGYSITREVLKIDSVIEAIGKY